MNKRDGLRFTAALSAFLTAVFLFQQFIIMPLEGIFADAALAAIASLVFIPHGVKVLVATLSGYFSIVPIMIAQFIGGLFYDLDILDAFLSACIGALAILIPLVVVRITNFYKEDLTSQANLFWVMMTIGCGASVFNSMLISLYRGYEFNGISLRFFIGDILGTAVVFLVLLLFRKPLMKLCFRRIETVLEQQKPGELQASIPRFR